MARRRVRLRPAMPVPATRGSPGPVGGRGPSESCAGRRPGCGPSPGAQPAGGVDAVAASQRRRNQGHPLVARVRPARGISQVEALLDEFGQAEAPRQGGRKDQPGIGPQAVIVFRMLPRRPPSVIRAKPCCSSAPVP